MQALKCLVGGWFGVVISFFGKGGGRPRWFQSPQETKAGEQPVFWPQLPGSRHTGQRLRQESSSGDMA